LHAVRKIVTVYLHTKYRLPNPTVCYHRKQNSEAKFCTAAICCYSFCKYGSWEAFQASPLSTATQNSMDRQKRAQEHYGEIIFLYFRILSFPGRQSVSPLSLHAVCVSSRIFYWATWPIFM